MLVCKLASGQESSDGHDYSNPLLLTFNGYTLVGISLIFFYMIPKWYLALDPTNTKPEMPAYLAIVPAFFEVSGVVFNLIGLTMVATSVYQMLRGIVVFVVAIYSLVFLKRKFYSHHYLGLFTILVGISFVSWGGIRASEKKQ